METWENIPWYDWYLASDMWNIKSENFSRTWKCKTLSNIIDHWYCHVNIYKNKNPKKHRVHRLIMLTFKWPSDLSVNHINWIKTDNRLENLEYCTAKENTIHAYQVLWHSWPWLWKKWKEHNCSKKVIQYSRNWDILKTWHSTMDVKRELWIAANWISTCCNWIRKTCWWFVWKYE